MPALNRRRRQSGARRGEDGPERYGGQHGAAGVDLRRGPHLRRCAPAGRICTTAGTRASAHKSASDTWHHTTYPTRKGPVRAKRPWTAKRAHNLDQRAHLNRKGGFQLRPGSTEAATRPNKEHRNAREFPFLHLALAIHAENDQNGGMIRSMVTTKCRFLRIGEITPAEQRWNTLFPANEIQLVRCYRGFRAVGPITTPAVTATGATAASTWPAGGCRHVVPPVADRSSRRRWRSNCLVCQGAPRMLSDSSLLRLPGGVVVHHGVQNRQQLAHAGRQRDLRGLPRRPQALIKRFEYRIIAHRHEGPHVQGGPHVGASPQIVRVPRRVPLSRVKGATPPRAASRWRLSVPNSGRSSSSVRAQTGPMPGTRRSNSSRSRQTGLARRVVSRSSSSAARRSLSQVIGAWISAWRRRGALPRRFCSAVRMATNGRRRAKQGAEFVRLRVGPWPWGWPDGLGNVGQRAGLEGLRLGQLPRGVGKVAGLARIDHRDGQTRRRQRGHHGPLVAPGGFEHNEVGGRSPGVA